jgi:hypothetical protein
MSETEAVRKVAWLSVMALAKFFSANNFGNHYRNNWANKSSANSCKKYNSVDVIRDLMSCKMKIKRIKAGINNKEINTK